MTKSIKLLIILAVTLIPLLVTFFSCVSNSNNEVDLRNHFTQTINTRTALMDKMWKVLSQKSQIVLRNDSSFRENINIIMSGRKDADQVVMKWITESNPNANYSEVSSLYKELSRTVESEREGFFQQEKVLQDIKYQHDNLLDKFPGNILFSILGRKHLEYKPITSDRTDEIIKTGKDNDVKLF